MDLSNEQLFDFFKGHPEKPWHVQELQKRLKVKNRTPLRHALDALVDEGRLVRTRRRSYGLPQEMNLMLGRLQITSGGYGFVIPEKEGEKDLFIPADALAGAWDGDRVMARPNPHKENGRVSGQIVRVLKRKHDHVVGTLEYSKGYAILRPDSTKLRERVLLLPDSVGKLEAGSRIVAKMVWPSESGEKDPFGEVEEVLGGEADPKTETRAVVIKYGLKDEFDAATLQEAEAVPPNVSGDMLEGRTDLRGISTFTIDGADAKDFDDAISLERLTGRGKKGLLRVGIHIADVSYYVAEGTSLDKEALERATSVYLPGRVLPMLPEALSNGICSLVEGEARLALSAMVDITRAGEIKSVKFKETVIESDARLTYEQVQAFAEGEGRFPKGKRKLERDVKVLLDLSQSLRKKRIENGALDFNFTEARVDVGDEGELELKPVSSNAARQLVEELMLLANRLVAKELSTKDIPALFRVHEDPSGDKLENLERALGRLGYTIDLKEAKPQDLQEVLKTVAGKPEAQLVNTLLLRSLKQARYSADNLGHFGLAFENYLHFTSPIRRYPDLVVHRVLRAMLQRRLSPTLKERLRNDFPALSEHTSERERNAEDAERDLTRFYHARWAKDHVGEVFAGLISGVTNFGVFVALPNAVEGLIHVSQLDDDYYVYLEDSLMLLGKHSRKKFRMGDRLEIKILAANPVQRQIDLIPGHQEMPDLDAEEKAEVKPSRKPPKELKTPLNTRKSHPKDAERAEQNAEPAEARAPKKGVAAKKTSKAAPTPKPARRPGKRRVLIFGDPNLKK